jgi:hypothetical protein
MYIVLKKTGNPLYSMALLQLLQKPMVILEWFFVIFANGKLTLHVGGNVAAYKVSHPTATEGSDVVTPFTF